MIVKFKLWLWSLNYDCEVQTMIVKFKLWLWSLNYDCQV